MVYFRKEKKILKFGAGVLAVSIFAIFYGTQGGGAKSSIQARAAFEQWKKTPGNVSLTKEMVRTLKKAPNLRRGLEAEIAQIFLSDGQVQNADAMAALCIARLNADSPLHAEFAKTSLLIEQNEYQKALEASVTLKERLELLEGHTSLQGWNLLRLAFLHKKLENQSGELAAWAEVKAFMQQEEGLAGKSLETGIGRPDFSLADFISFREREIAQ
jgi:hypothetical protein